MATHAALASQEHAEAIVSASTLTRNYPPRDQIEDHLIAAHEDYTRTLINTFVPAKYRPTAHTRLDALMARIWEADKAADGYVLAVAQELVDALMSEDRHRAAIVSISAPTA